MSNFRIQEFAQLAGVTVRALHHYDRLKLLSPALRSERGYRRLYDDESHWPDDETAARLRANRPKPEYTAFFREAVQACLRHG